MAEPVTSHEIEDVLASIRRLVEDEFRPAPRPAAASASGSDRASEAAQGEQSAGETAEGRLMLTPALRVVGEEGAALAAPVSFGEAAPLGAAPLTWQPEEEPVHSETLSETYAPAEGEGDEEGQGSGIGDAEEPLAVFTAAPRPAPLILTRECSEEEGAAAAEIPAFRHHPRQNLTGGGGTEAGTPARGGAEEGMELVMDEVTLRALLRQIVREELAALQLGGESGEARRKVRLDLRGMPGADR